MLSKTVSTAISAFVLVMPVRFTTSLMMSSLINEASSRIFWARLQPVCARNFMIGLDLVACQGRTPEASHDTGRFSPGLFAVCDWCGRAYGRRWQWKSAWADGEFVYLGVGGSAIGAGLR